MIKEWNFIRVIASLTIVVLHSSTQIGRAVGYPQIEYYSLFRVFMTYATPTFVVLSVIILANRYPDKIPKGFFKKRIKYILMPFIAFAIIDAFVVKNLNPNILLFDKMFTNIFLGTYEGYFVLIIMQFYLLHYLVIRFNISMKVLLPISLLVMTIHLTFINSDIEFVSQYRYVNNLLFTAWFGYFTVGFLIGKYYKEVLAYLKSYKWLSIVGVLFSLVIIFINYESGHTAIQSKRLDLFPLVIFLTLTIITIGQYIPNNRVITLVSNYSFGIYLLHWQIQRYITPYVADYFNHTSTRVLGLTLITLVISMLIIKIVSHLPFGSYIVGNVKRLEPRKEVKVYSRQQQAKTG